MPVSQSVHYFLTGGAGFIGSRVIELLAARAGSRITVFDSLHPQVHGPDAHPPAFPGNLTFIRGDVRDREGLNACIADADPDVVIHLACETGTGQSAEEVVRYCETNVVGTANLIEALRNHAPRTRRVVLSSSRAIYGEGAYRDDRGNVSVPTPRHADDMVAGRFVPTAANGGRLTPMATREDLPPAPASVYGSTKLMQELLLTQSSGNLWSPVILRLQNVYGPGQSLRNPYTGVLTIFCQQILSGKRLDIYEDGNIIRDFVFVDDVASAIIAATETPSTNAIVNIGSGQSTSILDAAKFLIGQLGKSDSGFDITGHFRTGDIRHAVADISRAHDVLGWVPRTDIEAGLTRLAQWASLELS